VFQAGTRGFARAGKIRRADACGNAVVDCHGDAAVGPRSAGRGILAGVAPGIACNQDRGCSTESGRRQPTRMAAAARWLSVRCWQAIGHPVQSLRAEPGGRRRWVRLPAFPGSDRITGPDSAMTHRGLSSSMPIEASCLD